VLVLFGTANEWDFVDATQSMKDPPRHIIERMAAVFVLTLILVGIVAACASIKPGVGERADSEAAVEVQSAMAVQSAQGAERRRSSAAPPVDGALSTRIRLKLTTWKCAEYAPVLRYGFLVFTFMPLLLEGPL
jgi:hypothetical protein